MSSVITTDFERWKAQEAALGKPVALNEFVFANVPGLDPSKDISRDEKLPPSGQIVHRQAVNKAGLANENAVAYSVTLGTDAGDFVFNWIGLVNKESGTLAMITHAPEQRKIKTVDGVQGNVLTRSFLLEFNGAAKETQITTSAETWQIDFTARLAGMDEIQRLANRDIYGAAAFFGDGFLVTKAAEQYRVTPGTAYIEGLRGTLEEITTFNNLRDTKIYADFTFQGNLVSKWQTFVKVTTAKTLANYQDAAGFQHYVAVIAEIDKNGNITDKRVKGTAIDRELAELKKDLPEKYQPKGEYQPKGDYQPAGDYQLKGDYQPAGDYADGKRFHTSPESVEMITPNGSIIIEVTNNGYVNVINKETGLLAEILPAGLEQKGGSHQKRMMSQKGVTDLAKSVEAPVGMFTTFPHRATQLPPGWYSTNGDRFSVSSPQGLALKSLPSELKSDWKITESGGMINVPNIKQSDGRTPFLRPVNGTNRQVGNVDGDKIRNIYGDYSNGTWRDAGGTWGDATGAFYVRYDNGVSPGAGSNKGTTLFFDASRVVPTGSENKPLDIGVTLAIYLGGVIK